MSITRRAFSSIVTARNGDEILIPRLRAALHDPNFAEFSITMPAMRQRKPDGWFHPSTHPLWGERQLWYYMHSCDKALLGRAKAPSAPVHLHTEVLDMPSIFAIYQGHWAHAFIQHILFKLGLLKVAYPNGKTSADKVEFPVVDESLRSRGHMDGYLETEAFGLAPVPLGLEIKTMNSMKLNKCPKGPARDIARIAWLIEANPTYYAQAQEYMRIQGHREQRMLIVSPSYPFDMVEIALPYDEISAMKVATKYARVLEHLEDGTLPDPCCSVGSPSSSTCPARQVCPIGKMSA